MGKHEGKGGHLTDEELKKQEQQEVNKKPPVSIPAKTTTQPPNPNLTGETKASST